MPVADFAHNVQAPFFSMTGQPAPVRPATQPAPVAASSTDSSSKSGKSFFDNLLDVINPLEHIPIVSTIYDKLTGNKTGTLEQIAGDTLYGGVTGLAASVAGAIFKQATGKTIADTVLALFEGDNSTKVADAATYLVRPAEAQTTLADAAAPASDVTIVSPGVDTQALMASLKRNGTDANLALRASYAYRQSVSLAEAAAP